MSIIHQVSGSNQLVPSRESFSNVPTRLVFIVLAALTLLVIALTALRNSVTSTSKVTVTIDSKSSSQTKHLPPPNRITSSASTAAPIPPTQLAQFLAPIDEEAFNKLPKNIQRFRKDLYSTSSEPCEVTRTLVALIIRCHQHHATQLDRHFPEQPLVQSRYGLSSTRDSSHFPYLSPFLSQLTPSAQGLLFSNKPYQMKQNYLKEEELSILVSSPPLIHFNDDEIIELLQGIHLFHRESTYLIVVDLLGPHNSPDLPIETFGGVNQYLQFAGLEPIRSAVSSLDELQEKIVEHKCSAIVTMQAWEGQEIVVDAVEENQVLIRDPYHNWAIAVTKESFLKYWGENTHMILQARRQAVIK